MATVAELRKIAGEAGLSIPAGSVKADIEALIAEHDPALLPPLDESEVEEAEDEVERKTGLSAEQIAYYRAHGVHIGGSVHGDS